MTISNLFLAASGMTLVSAWVMLLLIPNRVPLPVLIAPYLGLVNPTPVINWRKRLAKPAKPDGAVALELPMFLELLAYSVTSGAPLSLALVQVTNAFTGTLFDRMALTLSASATGESISPALEKLAREIGDPALSRAVRAIEISVERGTALAEVLLAQAAQLRAEQTNALTTLAARKETLMMLPVVFLILPVIVLVALFPGLIELEVF
jgi:tight adherence protein C